MDKKEDDSGNVRLERQVRRLTDDECNDFRRMPLSFNDMVRAIFEAGVMEERTRCINIKLVTEDRYGAQWVEPASIDIEDDGSKTIVVEAWR